MPSVTCAGYTPHTARAGEGPFDLSVDARVSNDSALFYTVTVGVFVAGAQVNSTEVTVSSHAEAQEVILTNIPDPEADSSSPIAVGENPVEVEITDQRRGTGVGRSVKSVTSERTAMPRRSPTESCGSLTVLPAFDASNVFVSNCPTINEEVEVGDTVTFAGDTAISAINTNDAPAEFMLTLYLDGEVVAQKSGLTLDGQQGGPFEMSFTAQSAGENLPITAFVENAQPADGQQTPQANIPGVPSESLSDLSAAKRAALATVGSAGAVAAAHYVVGGK